jgi:flavin reductase (DIM6/NTAB) family NADH-FMN oxidoreductase RutF
METMPNAISSPAFREALAHFASGVTIVSTHTLDGPVGCTVTAFASASLEPPLVLICIDKTASIYNAIVGAGHFAVHILEANQGRLAMRFATSGIDRFEGVALREADVAPLPLIEDALVTLECRRYGEYPAGDHTIVLGEVLAAHVRDGEPLLHHARRFGSFAKNGTIA